MDHPADVTSPTQQIFRHYLYEYRKGVRQLFMMTMSAADAALVVPHLEAASDRVSPAGRDLDEGQPVLRRAALVATVRSVVTKPPNMLTLLGYHRDKQCLRFLARSRR